MRRRERRVLEGKEQKRRGERNDWKEEEKNRTEEKEEDKNRRYNIITQTPHVNTSSSSNRNTNT